MPRARLGLIGGYLRLSAEGLIFHAGDDARWRPFALLSGGAVRRSEGYLQLHAAIAFGAWRLGVNSVEVAETLGMRPQAVRQALWRMRDTARRLGLDGGRPGYTTGIKRKHKNKCRA